MNCLDLYCKNVIQSLENFRKEVAEKYYTSLFHKKGYKKLLDKIDDKNERENFSCRSPR